MGSWAPLQRCNFELPVDTVNLICATFSTELFLTSLHRCIFFTRCEFDNLFILNFRCRPMHTCTAMQYHFVQCVNLCGSSERIFDVSDLITQSPRESFALENNFCFSFFNCKMSGIQSQSSSSNVGATGSSMTPMAWPLPQSAENPGPLQTTQTAPAVDGAQQAPGGESLSPELLSGVDQPVSPRPQPAVAVATQQENVQGVSDRGLEIAAVNK